MIYTQDKIKHYQLAFKFGRYGSLVGFLLIVAILAPCKEIFDYIVPNHCCEWDDYKAGVVGAWDGMMLNKQKF